MRSWEFHRDLDPDAPQPLFVQLVRAITDDISGGRLTPGQRLPGSRTLARSLGVHRNTVLAAYSELAAEGWIVTRIAQATASRKASLVMADILGARRAPVEIQFRDRGQTSPRSAWLGAAIAAVAERSAQRTGTHRENR